MNLKNIPELLAPAGSTESFFAAIDSGADAVYLGLKSFSARGRANNFSIPDLEKVIPYAHSLGRKIYVALNTIIKEEELPRVVDDLAALSILKADALIIQDLGVYRISSRNFPELPLHASTQMTVHNSMGMNQLLNMGFKRAVVAREMTLEEIKAARKKTDIEIEAFVHGAMCFCYAGSCFFSSFLGGKSSNRGVCTQPCRREYRDGHDEMNPFSMGDLSALDLLPQLMKSGIDSFKIEGRMKPAEYVENVVKAYRMVMDAAPADQAAVIDDAKDLLKNVVSRQRTSGFFLSDRPSSITFPGRSGNLGKFAGKVIDCKGTRARIKTSIDLHVKDRLRIQNVKSGGRTAFSLNQIWLKGNKVSEAGRGNIIEITAPHNLNPGDSIFKTTSHEHRGRNIEAKKRLDKLKAEKIGAYAQKLSEKVMKSTGDEWPKGRDAKQVAGTLIKVAVIEDSYRFFNQCNGVIVPLFRANIHSLRKHLKRLKSLSGKVVWSLPLVIQEGEVSQYNELVEDLVREGFSNWQVSNIGHFEMLKKHDCNIVTSQYLHALNSSAFHALAELGCGRISLSIESDDNDLDALAARVPKDMADLLVYSHLPLYVSRVKWDKKRRSGYGTSKGEKYTLKEKDGLTYVYSEKPLSFLSYMKRFRRMGFNNFQIDLSGESGSRENVGEILGSFKTGKGIEEASPMNMETGLE